MPGKGRPTAKTKKPLPPPETVAAIAKAGTLDRKPLYFVGAARKDFVGLPANIRRKAGWRLLDVQCGELVPGAEAMNIVGAGVVELKVDDAGGWYRVFYVAKFAEGVYVLHSFKKKTNKTAAADIELGQRRYELLVEERKKLEPKK